MYYIHTHDISFYKLTFDTNLSIEEPGWFVQSDIVLQPQLSPNVKMLQALLAYKSISQP